VDFDECYDEVPGTFEAELANMDMDENFNQNQLLGEFSKKLYFSHQSQLFLDDSTNAAKIREQ
jgi:hypothetical protein